VPPEFEVTKDMISTAHQENLITTVPPHIGNCRPNTRKFTRRPSNKFIANSLVLLGGAICLSRGHSSLGAKVAMAYIFSKLTNRGASSKQAGNLPCNKATASANGKFSMAVNIDVDLCIDLSIAPYLRVWKNLEDFLEEIVACAF
ncbi:UNVERIFIED_CONTAM: hypothetical protein Sindi_0426800, partial [Sesamum indicum]